MEELRNVTEAGKNNPSDVKVQSALEAFILTTTRFEGLEQTFL